MRVKVVFLLLCAICFNEVSVFSSSGVANQAVIPGRIRDILEANAKSVNPISLSWTQTRSTSNSLEELHNKLGASKDYGLLEKRVCAIMWQGNKAYYVESCNNVIEISGDDVNKYPKAYEKGLERHLSVQERSFDGQVFCAGSGSRGTQFNDPTLGVYPIEVFVNDPIKYTFYQRYTQRIGYKYPSIGREMGDEPQSYVLFLAKNGELLKANEETIDGTNYFCVIARCHDSWERTDRKYKLLLDPKLNYAVVRCEILTLDDKLAYLVENEEFQIIPGTNVYLPKKSRTTYFTDVARVGNISNKPLFVEECVLTEISVNQIADVQFDLRKKYTEAGTLIGDRTLSNTREGVQYKFPANPADLDRVIEAALTGGTFVPTPIVSTWAVVFRWLTLIAGTIMILWGLYRIFTKKHG